MRTLTIAIVVALCAVGAHGQSDTVPQRTDENLIVAAYNIQWLGEKPHKLDKLAKVIQHFDVCGIVEVKDESAVRELRDALEKLPGDRKWGYTYGVRTHRPGGRYHEAYAAVWRRDRAELGDGVVGGVWDLEEAYRNDPYLVSFRSKLGNFDFTMMLIHTRWTDDDEGTREGEVAMIPEQLGWMLQFMEERDWLIAGDFNYSGAKPEMEVLAVEGGLEQIEPDQKTTFKKDLSAYANSYDHIYVISGETDEFTGESGVLDATKVVYGSTTKANMKKSKKELSDHLPVWAVFDTSGADDD